MRRLLFVILLLIGVLGYTTNLLASGLQIEPVKLRIAKDNLVTTINITNIDEQPILLQLKDYQWTQSNGKDNYTDTDDLLVTPPIFELPPKGMQVVRIAFRQQPDPSQELAYRLYIKEILNPKRLKQNGLRLRLQISVPIFVLPQAAIKQQLVWQSWRLPHHRLKIRLSNMSNGHIQINKLVIRAPSSRHTLASQDTFVYLLPNQHKDWLFRASVNKGQLLQISAETDEGENSAKVTVQKI